MINDDRGFLPSDREFTQWPTDMRQRAFDIIATTRYEWLYRNPRCHLPVTQFVADCSLGRYEKRLRIADLRVRGDDMHRDIHRICG
jgi:hypothetical protein